MNRPPRPPRAVVDTYAAYRAAADATMGAAVALNEAIVRRATVKANPAADPALLRAVIAEEHEARDLLTAARRERDLAQARLKALTGDELPTETGARITAYDQWAKERATRPWWKRWR